MVLADGEVYRLVEQESPETDLHVIWSISPFQQRCKPISGIKEQSDINVQKCEPRPIS